MVKRTVTFSRIAPPNDTTQSIVSSTTTRQTTNSNSRNLPVSLSRSADMSANTSRPTEYSGEDNSRRKRGRIDLTSDAIKRAFELFNITRSTSQSVETLLSENETLFQDFIAFLDDNLPRNSTDLRRDRFNGRSFIDSRQNTVLSPSSSQFRDQESSGIVSAATSSGADSLRSIVDVNNMRRIAETSDVAVQCDEQQQPQESNAATNDIEWSEELKNGIKCTICQEICHQCVTVCPCAHTFCGGCLSLWFNRCRSYNTCPTCREVVHSVHKNVHADQMAKLYLINHPQERRSEEELEGIQRQDTLHCAIVVDFALSSRQQNNNRQTQRNDSLNTSSVTAQTSAPSDAINQSNISTYSPPTGQRGSSNNANQNRLIASVLSGSSPRPRVLQTPHVDDLPTRSNLPGRRRFHDDDLDMLSDASQDILSSFLDGLDEYSTSGSSNDVSRDANRRQNMRRRVIEANILYNAEPPVNRRRHRMVLNPVRFAERVRSRRTIVTRSSRGRRASRSNGTGNSRRQPPPSSIGSQRTAGSSSRNATVTLVDSDAQSDSNVAVVPLHQQNSYVDTTEDEEEDVQRDERVSTGEPVFEESSSEEENIATDSSSNSGSSSSNFSELILSSQ